jgi:hypothetical protein
MMTPILKDELHAIMDQQHDEIMHAIQQSQITAKVDNGKITAEAFWWGMHIVIPEGPLKDIETASNISKVVAGLIGTGFGVAGIPPVAIVIGIIVAVWGAESIAINAVDQGKGVYLSWIWPQVALVTMPPFIQSLPIPTAIK